MDNKNERVLAYQKSKPISKEDLEKISGGVSFTSGVCGGPSGGCGGNTDQHGDVHFDW